MATLRLPSHPRKEARPARDAGSGLTEFVIITPLFIILIFWSEFFVDAGIVKMKMEEAARYAAWEMTAQRTPEDVQLEIKDRFADLNSPRDMAGSLPSTRSFRSISMEATISAPQAAPMTGTPPPSPQPSNAILRFLQGGLSRLTSTSVPAFLRQLGSKWNTTREYSAKVSLSVTNTLFPTGSILGLFLDTKSNLPGSSVVNRLQFKSSAPPLLVDTWKAWPGPMGYTATNANTDVRKTYSATGSNVVEQELSKRLDTMTFGGAANSGGILQILGFIVQLIGLVNPVSCQTWDQGGPVVAWAGATALHNWSPSAGTHIQRVADLTLNSGGGDDATVNANIPSPERIVASSQTLDRTRYTTPSRINSVFWQGGPLSLGGLSVDPLATAFGSAPFPGDDGLVVDLRSSINKPQNNPYVLLYNSGCRDGYYMGATKSGVNRWKNAVYFQQLHPACPGSTNTSGGSCPPGWICS